MLHRRGSPHRQRRARGAPPALLRRLSRRHRGRSRGAGSARRTPPGRANRGHTFGAPARAAHARARRTRGPRAPGRRPSRDARPHRAAAHDGRLPPRAGRARDERRRAMSWRRLRTLLRREMLATYRDPFTMTILVAVPLVALLLFGFVLSTKVKHMALGVHDASDTPASRRLVADLAAGGTFDPRPFATREALERALVAGKISTALVIPPDFARDLGDRAPGSDRPEVQVL